MDDIFYIYGAIKEFDSYGFTEAIIYDLIQINIKVICDDLYFEGKIWKECESRFYNEVPELSSQVDSNILIDPLKGTCS